MESYLTKQGREGFFFLRMHGTMHLNSRGHLEIGGCDTVQLAQEFGTPLYVLDESLIRERCRQYCSSLARHYPDSEVLYAGKTFLALALCRIMEEEGLGLDVASGGELYTALRAGFPPHRLYFNGNNKSPAELFMALEAGIGRIVVDNLYELDLLEHLARRHRAKARILIRVTPGIEAHTHHYIQTGQEDSKFGLGLQSGAALEGVRKALSSRSLLLKGLHCHIGSQIFDLEPYRLAAEAMIGFMAEIRDHLGVALDELDLGGGLGIPYLATDEPPSVEDLITVLASAVKETASRRDLPLPRLILEPGRSLVGDAGTTLYTVGAIKRLPGVRNYLAVDGGMADNPRHALYGARYEAILANRAAEPGQEVYTVAGKCCESGDILIRDLLLPQARPGDILAVSCTGAYNYSMSSNYNRLPRPATVLVAAGQADLILERETYEDLIAKDIIPKRLGGTKTLPFAL